MPLNYLKTKYRRSQIRRTPTGDKFCFADSIDYLAAGHWDIVCESQGILFSRDYLRCLEQNSPSNLLLKYALIYRDDQPVAAVAMQILDTDLSVFLSRDSQFSKGSQLIRSRIFTCGSMMCGGNRGVAVRPGVDFSSVWPSVAEILLRVRRAAKISGETDFVLVRDLPSRDPDAVALKDYGYRPVDVDPDMILDLRNWDCYEDYLASLQSKYRKAVKKVRKRLSEANCSVVELPEPELHRQRLHELYREVWSNADVRPVEFAPDYLVALKGALGPNYSLLVMKQEQQILGFVTLIKDGEKAIAYILGFDRQAATGLPLYLGLLQAAVELGLRWGCQSLSFGGTALEPKARLGATPQARQVWARHRLTPLNVLIRPLLEGFSPEQAPQRNPFKS